jgi:hypothetical protein
MIVAHGISMTNKETLYYNVVIIADIIDEDEDFKRDNYYNSNVSTSSCHQKI